MRRPRIVLLLAALAVSGGQRGARADEQRLGEVVVTAPAVAADTHGRDPTAFATVIDTTQAPAHVETLADALSDTVGVQVRRFGGLGDFSTVSIRGSAAGQVQVYLDGVPLARAQNEVVNLSDLPLDAIDHIEVYRGTTPLAFAQSGPGGVVNVVTRRPGAEPLTAASVSGGSFGTRRADVARAATVGAFDYLAFAHYLGSEGDFRFTNDLGTTVNTADDRTERRVNNAFDQTGLTARVGWRPSPALTLGLTTDTFWKDEGVPGAGSVQARDTSLETLRQLVHLDGRVVPTTGVPITLDTNAWALHQQQTFADPKGELGLLRTDTEDRTTAAGGQLLLRGALGAHQAPGLLLAASHERFAERDDLRVGAAAPDRTRVRGTVAGEDEIVLLGERLALVPGLRWEVYRDDFPGDPSQPAVLQAGGTTTRDFFSPHGGVRVEALHGLTLLANVGRYAREPNLDELFGNRGVVVGNPNLVPETAWNRDVGARATPPPVVPWLDRVALEYAYFDNAIDDLIVLVQNSQRIVRPENVTSAHVRGHEVAVRGRIAEHLDVVANYTHQDARDDGDVSFLRGKRLPGRPADEAYVKLELGWSPASPLPLGKWAARLPAGRLSYDVNLIADDFLDRANVRRVDSRALHGVGLEVALPLPGVRLALEAKNVGDDRTRDALGFPLPGRAFFATLSYGFGRDAKKSP